MKESLLKALTEDKEFYFFNTELNENIIKEYLFENVIKKITLEDMDELVNIVPTTNGECERVYLVGLRINLLKYFSLRRRMDMMNELAMFEKSAEKRKEIEANYQKALSNLDAE
jgi:hypothetical protein